MKNTLQNKREFFAQYYGQSIGSIVVSEWDQNHEYEIGGINGLSFHYINLIPMAELSEKDKKEKPDMFFLRTINNCGVEYVECRYIDYLRKKGYAVPFRGVNVKTLIKWGWVKLIEPNTTATKENTNVTC